MINSENGCPVCGYPEFEPLNQGCTSFEICCCCGFQSGYEYNERSTSQDFEKLRKMWIEKHKKGWWSKATKPPKEWSAEQQMKAAGIDP
jgi:uncharacterized Zn finger protein (UPF0148 family)